MTTPTIDRAPTRFSSGAAVCAAFVALVASGLYSWPALAAGALGLGLVVLGLARGSIAPVTTGACCLFVAAILAGVQRAPIAAVLVGVTAAVLAGDAGGTAVSLGRQLGREAETRRLEAVRFAASAAVGLGTAAVGYGLYLVGPGRQPIVALVCSLLAAVLLVQALE